MSKTSGFGVFLPSSRVFLCVCLQIEHGPQEYVIKVMTHDQLNHHSSTCPYKLRLVTPVSPKRPPNVLSDCNSRHFFFSLLCLDQISSTHRVVRKPPCSLVGAGERSVFNHDICQLRILLLNLLPVKWPQGLLE